MGKIWIPLSKTFSAKLLKPNPPSASPHTFVKGGGSNYEETRTGAFMRILWNFQVRLFYKISADSYFWTKNDERLKFSDFLQIFKSTKKIVIMNY